MEHMLHGEGGVEFTPPLPESYDMRRQLEGSLEDFVKENKSLYKVKPEEKKKMTSRERQQQLERAEKNISPNIDTLE